MEKVIMLNAYCDRCGKMASALYPFHLRDTITYRGREINKPWLCMKCFVKEKEKAWKEKRS